MWYTYETDTHAIVKSYKTRGGAKAAITRAQNKYEEDRGEFACNHGPLFELGFVEAEYYHKNMDRKVKKVNLMTGKEYEESINTPLCCSPSSETYWSM